MASYENHLVHRRAVREGLENLRVNRRALRVCLVLLSDNDLLYIPDLPGADFNPTDYGCSPEYFALELALGFYYRPLVALSPPLIALPALRAFGDQYTYEELEADLE